MICSKAKYTKRQAQEVLNRIMKTGRMEYGRIYPCHICKGFWHLTHTEFDEDKKPHESVHLKHFKKWKKLMKHSKPTKNQNI